MAKRAQGMITEARWVSAWFTLVLSACSGPDHLTDLVVSAGGNLAVSTGGSPSGTGGASIGGQSGSVALGGTANGGTVTTGTPTNAGAAAFDWGTNTYDAASGATVAYQSHFNGTACLAACHSHIFNVGGTVYSSNGTTAAANGQIGLLIDGTLTTTYYGSSGNFYVNAPSAGWATAQIALRTSIGTVTMPVNANASGNCNTCHDNTNRITAP